MPNTYDVYIRRWKNADGTPSSASEKLMFSIPQNNPEGFPLLSPTVKRGEDSADSLDFSMNVGMEYYDLLIPLRTIIRVEYYGNTIFYGRVLTVNASTVMQTRSVHCEGAFGFFNDSYYPATADTKREEISWSTYFDRILSNHNSYINGDDIKKFNRGTVDFTPTTQNKKFEPTGWTQTSSMLSSLKDELGGHMLSRYSGGYNYIDWYKYHKRDLGNGNRPVVQVGENVIDISSNMDVGNLFTRVIPVGKSDNDGSKITINGYVYTDRNGVRHTHGTDYVPVSLIRSLYSDAELSNDYHTPQDFDDSESEYGIIYKPVQFSDAATPEQLWNECAKWIKESFYGAVTSFEIRAIDMHIQNTSLPLILLGDCVDIYYKVMENGQMVTKYRKMIAKSIKYDLFNPSNNSYTFGIPSDLLKTSKSQSSSSNKKKTASQSISTPKTDDTPPDMSLTFKKIADIIRKDPAVAAGYGGDAAADSFLENGEISGTRLVYDADIHYERGEDHPEWYEEVCFNGQIVGKITLPNMSVKWVAFNNAHGLFAYIDSTKKAVPTMHWYTKETGYSYNSPSAAQYGAIGGVLKVIGAGQNIANTILEMNLDNLPTTKWFNPRAALDEKKATAAIFNTTGTIANIISKIGKDGTGEDDSTSIVQDGTSGKTTFYDNLAGDLSTRKTIEQNGLTGETSFYGTDTSSGITKKVLTALVSGFGGGSFDLSSLDTNKGISMVTNNAKNIINTTIKKLTGEKEVTAEISGSDKNNDGSSDTSIGKIKVGKNLAAGAAAGFKVVMNESQAYKGYRVNSQGQGEYFDTWGDGFVFANDLKLDSIPSFKTEKAVIDKLWADQATVNSLTVNNDAWIKDLTGETVKVPVIRAADMRSSSVNTTNVYASNYYVYGDDSPTGGGNLLSCVNGAKPVTVDSSGKVTITLQRIGPGNDIEITFDQAATTFYKNAVAAVAKTNHNKGGATAYATVSPVSLNPGGSSTITAYYTDYDGHAVNTGRTYTVSARSLDNDPDLTVTPGALQVFTAAKDGYKKVTVNAAPSVSHSVSNFDVGTNQGESSPRWGKSNASNQYYGISGAKTANVSVWIVLHAWWTCGGTSMNPNRNDDAFRSYLQAAPTAVYKRGWNDCIEKAKSNSSWTVPGTSTTYYLLPTTL